MPTKATLDLAVAKLKTSGLTHDHIKPLCLTVFDASETECMWNGAPKAPAIVFNYRDPRKPSQNLAPRPGWPPFKRVRLLGDNLPRDGKGRELRYTQEAGSGLCAYFPTLVDWPAIIGDPSVPILITEGELKAAKSCSLGVPCIGLGGVWSFLSTQAFVGFLPELEAVDWVKRRVYIVYDSDATQKPDVVEALNRLAHELEQRGAVPFTVLLPDLISGAKTGLDDYLVVNGDKDAFLHFIKHTRQSLTLAKPMWDLNKKIAVVKNPHTIVDLRDMTMMSPGAFKDSLFANLRCPELKVNPDGTMSQKSVPLAAHWLKWPFRHEVQGIVYEPGKPKLIEEKLNTWSGWGTKPVKGDVTPYLTLVDHLFKNAPKEAKEWFLRWCAYPIQHPGTKMYTSAVVHSREQGTGKSFLFYCLGRVYGKNFTEIRQNDLHNNFNGWAENKQLVLGDDVTGGEQRHLADMLKAMITQKELRLNKKYIPDYTVRDCVNYAFTSNQPDAFFLEDDDRRFFVHEVMGPSLDFDFFTSLESWLATEDGGNALHYYLLNLKLGDFDHRARALTTNAKLRMLDAGRNDLASWCEKLRVDPDGVLMVPHTRMPMKGDLFSSKELMALFDPTNQHKVGPATMARALRRAGIIQAVEGMPVRWDKGCDRFFIVRNLPDWARATMSKVRDHLNKTR